MSSSRGRPSGRIPDQLDYYEAIANYDREPNHYQHHQVKVPPFSSKSISRVEDDDQQRLLKDAIQFFFRHIRFDESTVARMRDNEIFQLFDERRLHYSRKRQVDSILIDSVYETTETHVATFILAILQQGVFSVTSFVIAIIYLSRLKECTRVSLHTYTWRLLFLTALLIADKAYEDKPIKNGSLAKLFPVVSAADLSELELTFLANLRFASFVRDDLYMSFLEKLGKESVSIEINAIVDGSETASQQISTLPCTPEPNFIPSQPVPAAKMAAASAQGRSRSRQPSHFGGSPNTSFQAIAGLAQPRRGRSPSVSRRFDSSSFVDDDNSLEYSRASSRRNSSVRRPPSVPPPPIFEPSRYQGHPRRFSLGRTPGVSPTDTTGHAFHSMHAQGPSPSPRSDSFFKAGSLRQAPLIHTDRWRSAF